MRRPIRRARPAPSRANTGHIRIRAVVPNIAARVVVAMRRPLQPAVPAMSRTCPAQTVVAGSARMASVRSRRTTASRADSKVLHTGVAMAKAPGAVDAAAAAMALSAARAPAVVSAARQPPSELPQAVLLR